MKYKQKSIFTFIAIIILGHITPVFALNKAAAHEDCIGAVANKDYKSAVQHCSLAAENGDEKAQFELGELYRFGLGVTQDLDKARDLYEKASMVGEERAIDRLAESVSDIPLIGPNLKSLVAAAKNGDLPSKIILARKYVEGKAVAQDLDKAVMLLREAVFGGSRASLQELYDVYELIDQKNGVVEPATDYKFFLNGALAGNRDAQIKLADIYFGGIAIEQDYELAIIWYEHSNNGADRNRQFEIGEMYFSGDRLKQDIGKAINWYEKAGNKGVKKAATELEHIYMNGIEVPQDAIKAKKWHDVLAQENLKPRIIGLEKLNNVRDGNKLNAEQCSAAMINTDYKLAAAWCQKAANKGDEDAQITLAELFTTGLGLTQDLEEAARWYRIAAIGGHGDSLKKLYDVFELIDQKNGKNRPANGFSLNIDKALAYNTNAMIKIGDFYFKGKAVKQDFELGIIWYERAGKKVDPFTQFEIGDLYFNGKHVRHDVEKAIIWYKRSARNGSLLSQLTLGDFYATKRKTLGNNREAFHWYLKAAYQNDAFGQYAIAHHYLTGSGIKKDLKLALSWALKAAASEQHPEARHFVSTLYSRGLGVDPNPKEAFKWLLKAAKNDHIVAQLKVGVSYVQGYGVGKNFKKATSWFEKSAIQGNVIAQFFTGNHYFDGIGAEQNDEKAFEWYLKAAKQNFVDAQYRVGQMYTQGLGVKLDYKQALYWFEKAMTQNHAAAHHNIGVFYEYGWGVVKSYEQAIEWYLKAAKLGDTFSLNNLGALYSKGNGVATDNIKAYMFLTLAGDLASATRNRKIVLERLSAEQLKQALRDIKDWKSKYNTQ